jgi:YegS/Rv2252/BmrU family lipid kinase
MQKVALFYNPASGRRRERREQALHEAVAVLQSAGKEVAIEPTRGPGTAAAQVREALGRGCDTIIIAGGDGTINDALQGLAGSEASLGVIPMGTGNVLAHDLGISHRPQEAARQLLQFQPRKIALGKVEFTGHEGARASRWFVAVAGVGGSAKLMYDVHAGLKGAHGMAAYYFQMARLALLHRFASFNVEYRTAEGTLQKCTAVEADAVRITNFGGLMRRWAWGAELQRRDAQLVMFTTSSRPRFLHYTFGRIFGTKWRTPGVEMVYAKEIFCTASSPEQRLYAEVDGEYIGGPPVKVEIVPDMLNLLMSSKV